MNFSVNICLLLLVFCASGYSSEDGPEVNTPLGRIRGHWQTSLEGKSYSSFEGIPFAKPPVGGLRFEEPVPVEPWPGIWKATKTYLCAQISVLGEGPILGHEDCLYLNVYVPGREIDVSNNFDVNVHIHGGGFQAGSGDLMSKSVLMMDQKDIIFVSLNYRLGALGFLSTEDGEIPGNNGLRDQVLAMKWVKDNIRSFGGNPDAITISGFSAGGASVHLHYFSQLSKGLFVRGISHSGTALVPWNLRKEPLRFTKRIAAGVGCPLDSTREIKKCLKKQPLPLIYDEVSKFYGYGFSPLIPFGPVIEKNSKNPFLDEYPYKLLKEGRFLDVPWVVSMSRDEGLLPTAFVCNQLETMNEGFLDQAQLFLDFNYTLPESRRKPFLKKVKDYYLGENQDINEENFYKFTELVTHGFWFWGIEIAAKLQSKATKSPVYFYLNNYHNEANRIGKFLCPVEKDIKGVCHCDETVHGYGFFYVNEFSENDLKVRKLYNHFFETYISGKEPSFDDNVKWLPTKGDEITYLNLTNYNDVKVQKIKSFVPDGVWDEVIEAEFKYFNVNIKDEL